MPEPIKVLIVEDSPTVSRILTSIIQSDPALQVVGVAADGAEAIRMVSRYHPNIITMDVNMPRMSGIEATEHIMAHQPTPILVLTAFSKQDMDISFKMLSAGALEILEKPGAEEWKNKQSHICERLKLLSRIKVITHVRGKYRKLSSVDAVTEPAPVKEPVKPVETVKAPEPTKEPVKPAEAPKPFRFIVPDTPAPKPAERPLSKAERDRLNLEARATAPLDPSKIYKPKPVNNNSATPPSTLDGRRNFEKFALPNVPVPVPDRALLTKRYEVVGIAASTGGPPALAWLLREFPLNMPVPVFVVQHIPAGFSAGLAEWLDSEVQLKVKLAEEGERPVPGIIYLPADDSHLAFLPDGRLHLDNSPARYGLRPSADITFESMSKVWPGRTLSAILTGMGRDGSQGMQKLRDVGGYNIAQDEASSVIFGMPKAAIELGVIDKVLPLGHIAEYIKQILRVEPPK